MFNCLISSIHELLILNKSFKFHHCSHLYHAADREGVQSNLTFTFQSFLSVIVMEYPSLKVILSHIPIVLSLAIISYLSVSSMLIPLHFCSNNLCFNECSASSYLFLSNALSLASFFSWFFLFSSLSNIKMVEINLSFANSSSLSLSVWFSASS